MAGSRTGLAAHLGGMTALPHSLDLSVKAGPLLRVVTGSRLHGFAHPASDHDAWVVVPEPRDVSPTYAAKRIFQAIEKHEDGTVTDITYVGLGTFLSYVANGVPQALETLFAPEPEVDHLGPFRHAYRVNPHTMRSSYRRMLCHIVGDGRAHEAKQRRHAFRLATNLRTGLAHGRFNPALAAEQRDLVLSLAAHEDGVAQCLEEFAGMALPCPHTAPRTIGA